MIGIDTPDIDYFVAVLDKLLEATGIEFSDIEKKRTVIKRIKRRYGSHFGEDHVVFHVLKMVSRLEAERREMAEVSDFFEDEKSESALEKLDRMTGLNNVKAVCHEFAAFAKEEARNRKLSMIRRNMIFYGNPGTGKTTVAGLIAEILAEVGVGPGTFVKAGRREVVGKYVGHTAPKVAGLFDEARRGVLFIDEAGFLTQTSSGGFVEEAVKELVRYMEERPDVCVIFAMYENEVKDFLDMDEGISSRISRMVRFDEYRRPELVSIATEMFKDRGYCLSKGYDKLIMTHLADSGIRTGNARDMRNLVEQIVIARSIRLFEESEPEKKRHFITMSDVNDGIERYTRERSIAGRNKRKLDSAEMEKLINSKNV